MRKLMFTFILLLPILAMAQPYIITTGTGGSYTAKRSGANVTEAVNQPMQTVVNAIRTSANRNDVEIQFGENGNVLNVGNAYIAFDNEWGKVTLTGKITTTYENAAFITLKDNVSMDIKAEISGGNATILHESTGKITILDGAFITTNKWRNYANNSTIYLQDIGNHTGVRLEMAGGKVTNTEGFCKPIYNNSKSGIVITGGTIEGISYAIENVSTGTLSISGGQISINNIDNLSSAIIDNYGGGNLNISGNVNISSPGRASAIKHNAPGKLSISENVRISSNGANPAIILYGEGTYGTIFEMTNGVVENTSTGPAIENASIKLNMIVSGGEILANEYMAIFSRGSESKLTVSGTAKISSANSDFVLPGVSYSLSGTINIANGDIVEIAGGTVENTSNSVDGRAIYNNLGKVIVSSGTVSSNSGIAIYSNVDTYISSAVTEIRGGTVQTVNGDVAIYNTSYMPSSILLGGSPVIKGRIYTRSLGYLEALTDFAPNGKKYTLEFDFSFHSSERPFAVKNGKDFFDAFTLLNQNYILAVDVNDIIWTTAKVTIDSESLKGGTLYSYYSDKILASIEQNKGNITFSITSGNLPPGLTLNADGTITGTPTQIGNYTFTVRASASAFDQKQFTIAIGPAIGGTVSGTVELVSKTHNRITISSEVSASNDQAVEYAISTSDAPPTSGWQTSLDFRGLAFNTTYHIFARTKANTTYNAGEALRVLTETTDATAQTQEPYVITYYSTSSTAFDVKIGSSVVSSNKSIANAISDIRADASGFDCIIQFGENDEALNIGSSYITIANDANYSWGNVTFRGNITNTTSSAVITVNGPNVDSEANISTTSSEAIRNNGTGTLTISGGTVVATDYTVYSNSAGSIIITGNAKIAATTGSAIYHYATSGKVIISENAEITSASTSSGYGTVYIREGSAEITGGTITNTSSGYAIYNVSSEVLNISGGKVLAATGSAIYHFATSGKVIISENAEITSTSTSSGYGTVYISRGSAEITGGTITNTSSGYAIYNASSEVLNISGGKVLAATGSAIYHYATSGKVIISGSAEITSANTSTSSGTLYIRSGTVEISGGTITNTASGGNAIYNSLTTANSLLLDGSPVIEGNIRSLRGTLKISAGFIPGERKYTFTSSSFSVGDIVWQNGGIFIENFAIADDTYGLSVNNDGDIIVRYGGFIKNGTNYVIPRFLTTPTISNTVSGIRIDANGSDCIIQFGENDEVLSIGSNSITIANDANYSWGNVKLTGNIANTSTSAAVITVNGPKVDSEANISTTSTYAILNNGAGILTISGGTVEATDNVVYNNSTGMITISGNANVSATNASGRVVYNASTGKITISENAVIESASTGNLGTVHIANGSAEITGGTIKNTAGNIAVFNSSANSILLGGKPTIEGRIRKASTGNIEVLESFAPGEEKYTLDFATYSNGTIAVLNGKNYLNAFAIYNTAYMLAASGENLIMGQSRTVTFNLNGATGTAPTTETVINGSTIAAPAEVFTRLGYISDGKWYTSSTGTTEFKFGETQVTSNITLYLKWTAAKVTIDTEVLAAGKMNEPYSDKFEASIEQNAGGTIKYSRSSGTLPAGLTLAEDGTISGTPTQIGTFSYTVNAQNFVEGTTSAITSVQKAFSIIIAPADGEVITGTATLASKTHNSITITALAAPSNGQAVEYAISTSNIAPETGWQTTLFFGNLLPNTSYNIFARAKSNANYGTGVASLVLTEATNGIVHAQAPTISTHPQSAELALNSSLILSVVAASNDGGVLSYQWYKNGIAISGATDATYAPSTADAGRYDYSVIVTNSIPDNGDGGIKKQTATSTTATVVVKEGTIVGTYGRLQACNSHNLSHNLCSEPTPVSLPVPALKGVSLGWSNTGWESASFFNARTVDAMVDNWKAQVIRVPVGYEINPSKGEFGGSYLDDKAGNMARAKAAIDAALAKDIYVIIDWHSHSAHLGLADAIEFFEEMAELYGHRPNVIFEIYNEPLNIPWQTIKSYSEQIIPIIREKSQNLIIVGTPNWDQDINTVIPAPLTDNNVAYVAHFYAATHSQSWLGPKINEVRNAGHSVFVSEFGTVSADGNGAHNQTAMDLWKEYLSANNIPAVAWHVNNKNEASSYFKPTFNPSTDNFTDQCLMTKSGQYIYNWLTGAAIKDDCEPDPIDNDDWEGKFCDYPDDPSIIGNPENCWSILSSESYTNCKNTSGEIVNACHYDGVAIQIDDFVNGTNIAKTGEPWIAFLVNNNATIATMDSEEESGLYIRNGYAEIKGVNLEIPDWDSWAQATIGLEAKNNGEIYDLAQCAAGFRYKYKGNAHRFSVNSKYGSLAVTNYVDKAVSVDWTTVIVNSFTRDEWDEAYKTNSEIPLNYSDIKEFHWSIRPNVPPEQLTAGYLQIKEFECLGNLELPDLSGKEWVMISDFSGEAPIYAKTGETWGAYTSGNATYSNANSLINSAEDGYIEILDIAANQANWNNFSAVTISLEARNNGDIYDLSQCESFSYEYKGNESHRFELVMKNGTEYYGHTGYPGNSDWSRVPASSEWETKVFRNGHFQRANIYDASTPTSVDLSEVNRMRWVVRSFSHEKWSVSDRNLQIRNFKCYGNLDLSKAPKNAEERCNIAGNNWIDGECAPSICKNDAGESLSCRWGNVCYEMNTSVSSCETVKAECVQWGSVYVNVPEHGIGEYGKCAGGTWTGEGKGYFDGKLWIAGQKFVNAPGGETGWYSFTAGTGDASIEAKSSGILKFYAAPVENPEDPPIAVAAFDLKDGNTENIAGTDGLCLSYASDGPVDLVLGWDENNPDLGYNTPYYTLPAQPNGGEPTVLIWDMFEQDAGWGFVEDAVEKAIREAKSLKLMVKNTNNKEAKKANFILTELGWDGSCDTPAPNIEVICGSDIYVNGECKTPYIVTFDLNGGSGETAIGNQTIADGSSIPATEKPETTGFTKVGFSGTDGKWYTDAEGTTEFVFGTSTITGATTLYLKWIPAEVAISTDAQLEGGTYGVAYTAQLAAKTNPDVGGEFTFALQGASLPAGVEISASGLVSVTPAQVGDITFTVVATCTESGESSVEKQFTISIDKATLTVADVDVPTLTAEYDPSKTLADIELPQGWSWDNDAETPTVAQKQYLASYLRDENHNILENVNVTVNVSHKPIAVPSANDWVYDGSPKTGVEAGTGYTIGGNNTAINANTYIATATPTENYMWNDGEANPTGSRDISWIIDRASQTAPDVTDVVFTARTSTTITLPEIAGIEISIDGSDWFVGPKTFEELNPGTGYTFLFRKAETANYKPSETYGELVFTTLKLFVVVFDFNGDEDATEQVEVKVEEGNAIDEQSIPSIAGIVKLNNATKGDWCLDADCDEPFDIAEVIESNTTLYLKWLPAYYVTFDFDNGDVESIPVAQGSTIADAIELAPSLESIAKAGFITAGEWCPDAVDCELTGEITESTTLYLQWRPATVTITTTTLPVGAVGDAYATAIVAEVEQNAGGTITYGKVGDLPEGLEFNEATGAISGTPTEDGVFTFSVTATNEASDASNDKEFTITVLPKYTVAFNLNEGSGTPPASIIVISGNKISAPAITGFTRNGYLNDGKWYADAAGTVEFAFNEPITSSATLYLKWTSITVLTAACETAGKVWDNESKTCEDKPIQQIVNPTECEEDEELVNGECIVSPIAKSFAAHNLGILKTGESFLIQGLTKAETVRIVDVKGKMLMSRTVMPNESVSISHLPKGMYLVNVNGKAFRMVK